MTEPTISVAPGVHIGTFARTENGGQINVSGATVQLAPSATVDKWFDASGKGSFISAIGFHLETAVSKPPWFWDAGTQIFSASLHSGDEFD